MFIDLAKNNGTQYLRLVRGQRVTNARGVRTVVKKTVLNIGPLSRFDDGRPGYLERLRQSFREGRPLIEALAPYAGPSPARTWRVEFVEGDDSCLGAPRKLAPCLLDPLFSALGLDVFLANVKHRSRLRYDLQGIVRLLVYGRLLDPASKSATMRSASDYVQRLVASGNDDNVYDALTVLAENRRQIVRRMNTCVSRGTGRSGTTVFYDVTNFFFETDEPDPDETDPSGAVVRKGLRKMGVSKENRQQPIVQMGLFLDEDGIPVCFEAFPGNTLDHQTLCEAMRRSTGSLPAKRFILVADRGMYNGTNMCHVTDGGNGYIVSKSLRKSQGEERAWAVSPEGYVRVGDDFRYKSRIVTRRCVDESGGKREFREKVVVYWSRAFYEREKCENQSFLDFVGRLRANPNGFRVTAAQSRSLRRFLKRDVLDKETGEVLDGSRLVAMIDETKLAEFNELMGYYQIASSELEMDAREIIDKYHGLTRIEDQFREMKGTLETRPVFVRTSEHIEAHLLVCFIALTMLRLVERKVAAALPPAGDGAEAPGWSYGLSGSRLARALASWQADELPGGSYRMLNATGGDIGLVLRAMGIDIRRQLYTMGELIALKAAVQPF